MNIQEIAVLILVAGAAIYLIFRVRRSLTEKQCTKGCGCAGEIHPVKRSTL